MNFLLNSVHAAPFPSAQIFHGWELLCVHLHAAGRRATARARTVDLCLSRLCLPALPTHHRARCHLRARILYLAVMSLHLGHLELLDILVACFCGFLLKRASFSSLHVLTASHFFAHCLSFNSLSCPVLENTPCLCDFQFLSSLRFALILCIHLL